MKQKNIARVLALLLALVMMTGPALAAGKFPDIPKGSAYASATEFLAERGIITGYPDGTYGPKNTITRAEMATILCRFTGLEEEASKLAGKSSFSDLSAGHWASGYVSAARKYGMINGYPNGTFGPEKPILLEEAIKTTMCVLEDAGSFDTGAAPWYQPYCDAAEERGLLKGTASKLGSPVTRDDMALILYNAGVTLDRNQSIQRWKTASHTDVYRDYSVRDSERYSWCIESRDANDVRLKNTFSVEPNTPYLISARVKLENVVNYEQKALGVQISSGNYDCSVSLLGNSDWRTIRKVTVSDEEGNLDACFDLGHNSNTCTGRAWFSGLTVEKLSDFRNDGDTTWHFLYVIPTHEYMDVTDPNTGKVTRVTKVRTKIDIQNAQDNISEFTDELYELSQGKISADLDTVILDAPFGGPKADEALKGIMSVPREDSLDYLVQQGVDVDKYDHIIFSTDMEQEQYGGLGGGTALYKNVVWRSRVFTWPGERYSSPFKSAVFVHEFLHSIEQYSKFLGLPCAVLHNGEGYGYTDSDGWKWNSFYRDFINKEISSDGELVGVDPIVWSLPPSVFK